MQHWSPIGEMKIMRMRTKLSIVSLVGAAALLLLALAAIIAPRTRTALADSHPFVDISIEKTTFRQQESGWLGFTLHNMPQGY